MEIKRYVSIYFFSREMALKTRPALDYKFRNQKGINSLAAVASISVSDVASIASS